MDDKLYDLLRVMFCWLIMVLVNLTESQNLDTSYIAVSKRCCPICWELLDVLRLNGRQGADSEKVAFAVRGRHPTIYAAEYLNAFRVLPRFSTRALSKYRVTLVVNVNHDNLHMNGPYPTQPAGKFECLCLCSRSQNDMIEQTRRITEEVGICSIWVVQYG